MKIMALLSSPRSSQGITVCSALQRPPSGPARGGGRGKVEGSRGSRGQWPHAQHPLGRGGQGRAGRHPPA